MTQLVNAAFDRHAMQRVSGWLARACLLLILVLPIVVLYFWAVANTAMLAIHAQMLPALIEAPVTDWQRLAGALVTCLPVSLMVRGLWEARLCFKQFAAGHVFTAQAVQRLRSFAGWIMASSLASILVGPVISVILTINNAVGNRQLAIGIGTDHVLTLLFAAVVWVMAAVIAQGQVLAEENSSFV
jgi:Protein of unknown function (DUF2975)